MFVKLYYPACFGLSQSLNITPQMHENIRKKYKISIYFSSDIIYIRMK